MKKLSTLGIGPKIGLVAIPYAAVAILLSFYFYPAFVFSIEYAKALQLAGIVIAAVGLVFYALTIVFLMKGVKNTQLMTSGTYYLCQNPLYTSVIFILLPGISLWINSWLLLTTCVVAYTRFKMNIHIEYSEMEEFFGDNYREYRKKTPEIFPFPFKKIFHR